tara:strand:+ start:366 stop:1043 length:678 start_codon:yes stop_codon:yes gene_type:complete
MSIAKKECAECHYRKPANQMRKKKVKVETGRSGSSFSFGTKGLRSARAFSGRKYYRNKTIWVCKVCGPLKEEEERSSNLTTSDFNANYSQETDRESGHYLRHIGLCCFLFFMLCISYEEISGGDLSAADNNGMFWLGLAAIVSTSTVYRTFNMGESFKTKLFLLFILTGMLIAFFEPQKANGGAKTPVGESREEKVTGGMSSGAPNWQNAGSAGNDSDESDIETF